MRIGKKKETYLTGATASLINELCTLSLSSRVYVCVAVNRVIDAHSWILFIKNIYSEYRRLRSPFALLRPADFDSSIVTRLCASRYLACCIYVYTIQLSYA